MIKNIILDFGDVFINLDKPATAREMKKFGLQEVTTEMEDLFKTYEMGHITSEHFLKHASNLFPKATTQQLTDAWNSILLDFPDGRLEFLEKLAQEREYRLFLLSNTNEMHIDFVKETMGMEKFNRFKNTFERFYLSYEMGKRKPDLNIYTQVLEENHLKSEETLFVDDTKENTDAAALLGIKTWNLQVGKEDIVHLKNHLV